MTFLATPRTSAGPTGAHRPSRVVASRRRQILGPYRLMMSGAEGDSPAAERRMGDTGRREVKQVLGVHSTIDDEGGQL